ncbi:MAG: C40 family peptidase [Paludibacteraceae bacterium]|nr:C40 family peptidase [Paludibacteraceae bacterium]
MGSNGHYNPISRRIALLLPLLFLMGWYACARSYKNARKVSKPKIEEAQPVESVIVEQLTSDAQAVQNGDPQTVIQSGEAKNSDKADLRNNPSKVGRLLDFARTLLGKPYKYGGETPAGFDCSGYTSYVFREFGVKLPHSSSMQYDAVKERVKRKDLQTGDLVFYAGRAGGSDINHVGIVTYVDDNDFEFIHAASTGIVISKNSQQYYADRYIGAARVKLD